MLMLLAGLAGASPLPPPPDVNAHTDYRRLLGAGVVLAGGADTTGAGAASITGEAWFFEIVGLGFGAWAGPATTYGPPGQAPVNVIAPIFTWDLRLLSVNRRVALDVVGRHPFHGGAASGFGAGVELRVVGPHLLRLAVLSETDGGARGELAYTLRWER